MIYNIMRKVGAVDIILKAVTPIGKQTVKAMGENVVDMQFVLPEYVDFKLNDFVILDGETYKINLSPTFEKKSDRRYEYAIQFEHEFYDLAKIQLQGLDPNNNYLQPVFNLMADAQTVIELIVENMNRDYSGWSVGVVDDTEIINHSFNAQNCLQVLSQLANDNQTEFWIENKTIHLQKRETASGLVFAYGQGNGLYNIRRQNKTSTSIYTRLIVRGSSDNLPIGYRNYAGSLLMPNGATYIQDDAKVELYGLIQHTEVFDIKPERIGSVSAITAGAGNWRYFFDATMNFNIVDFTSAKIHFNTGQLAGYAFPLVDYDQVTKRFTIGKNEDEKSLEIPSDLLRPAVGDKYAILGIPMPQQYIDEAENKLLSSGLANYEKNSDPKFLLAYSANCDPIFIRDNNVQVELGSVATIADNEMGLNVEVRIASYVRDLQDRDLYDQVEWSDTIGTNEIVRQYAQQQRTLQLIANSGLLEPNQIRKNIFLNRLSEQNGYLMLGGAKVKAGHADFALETLHAVNADYALDADKWDGRQFADYLNQPLRKNDAVEFLSVEADTIKSKLFVSGFTGSGYRVLPDGTAEFDSITIRKDLNVNVLNVREITGNGGSLAITNVAKINELVDNGDRWTCFINSDNDTLSVQLRANDIVRCQIWDGAKVKYYVTRVLFAGADRFDLSKAEKVGAGVPAVGDTVFQFGNAYDATRQGLIYLTNSDSGAPYIDVLDGVNSADLTGKTKVRFGKLEGINDPDLGQLDGYGLYAERGFFKGKIVVTGGNAQTIAGSQTLANNAQNNAIATASTDAQNKANTAQANANGYADSKSIATLNDAKTYADNSAQTKANIAQTNAISQASADAQAKANAAQANAALLSQQLVDGVKVGGRNYFGLGTPIETVATSQLSRTQTGFSIFGNIDNNGVARLHYVIKERGFWTVSFEAQCDINGWGILLDVCDLEMQHYLLDGGNSWVRITKTVNVTNDYNFVDIAGLSGQSFYFRNFKVESGSKATDWTPSPEDVQNAIDLAKSTADTAQASYNALTQNLKSMAYQDVVELSKLGSTVIDGGKIRTTLLDADYIKANIVNAGYVNTLELNAGAIKSGTIDSARINASQIVVDGGGAKQTDVNNAVSGAIATASADATTKANNAQNNAIATASTDAQNKANTAQANANGYADSKSLSTLNEAKTYADSSANVAQANAISQASSDAQAKANAAQANAALLSQQLVDGVKIGGRNYFKSSTYMEYHQGAYQTERFAGGFIIMGTAANNGVVRIYDVLPFNGVWTISFEARSTAADWPWTTAIDFGDQTYHVINLTTSFKKFSFTHNYTGQHQFVDIEGLSGQLTIFRDFKIEAGNKATDWTPAPEDVQSAIDLAKSTADAAQASYNALTTNLKSMAYQDVVELSKLGSTVIDGGKIRAVLLDADYIKANIVNAGYITALDIVAKTLAATSGTIGGWAINADKIISPYSGSLVNYKQTVLNKNGSIELLAYQGGYVWDNATQSWSNFPELTLITNKIDAHSIKMASTAGVVASFNQMGNGGAVALEASAPKFSIAGKFIGAVELHDLYTRSDPNNDAYKIKVRLVWDSVKDFDGQYQPVISYVEI